MMIRLETVCLFPRKADVHRLCLAEYPGHRRGRTKLGGCPNFARKTGCPPGRPLLGEAFDLRAPCYLVVNHFDMASHAAFMRTRHSDWSERQIYNCLYWQGTARRQLRSMVRDALARLGAAYAVEAVPESMGVDVTGTCALHGIAIEWPPREIARQVAFVGVPLATRIAQASIDFFPNAPSTYAVRVVGPSPETLRRMGAGRNRWA